MSESKEDIMEATFQALCKHGYSDLSIQKIANESDLGKSTIYYHFDDKEDLMLSFMDGMAEKIEEDYRESEGRSAEERLDQLFEVMMGTEGERWQFQKAFQELRVKAQSSEKFAEKLEETDRALLKHIAIILDDLGVENPEAQAEILISTIDGAVSRKVSMDDEKGLEELRDSIESMVEAWKK
jgi:AcrR family transcriptional regulator